MVQDAGALPTETEVTPEPETGVTGAAGALVTLATLEAPAAPDVAAAALEAFLV